LGPSGELSSIRSMRRSAQGCKRAPIPEEVRIRFDMSSRNVHLSRCVQTLEPLSRSRLLSVEATCSFPFSVAATKCGGDVLLSRSRLQLPHKARYICFGYEANRCPTNFSTVCRRDWHSRQKASTKPFGFTAENSGQNMLPCALCSDMHCDDEANRDADTENRNKQPPCRSNTSMLYRVRRIQNKPSLRGCNV